MELIALYAAYLVGAGAALALLWKVGRAVARVLRVIASRANLAVDMLVGREEIRHPDTGAVLAAATPGLGLRLSIMESALVHLAEQRDAIDAVTSRVDDHERRLGAASL